MKAILEKSSKQWLLDSKEIFTNRIGDIKSQINSAGKEDNFLCRALVEESKEVVDKYESVIQGILKHNSEVEDPEGKIPYRGETNQWYNDVSVIKAKLYEVEREFKKIKANRLMQNPKKRKHRSLNQE